MIRPSSLTLALDCDLSAVLGERFPTRNADTDRGNAVDDQTTDEINGGAEAADPDARALVAWVRENLTGYKLHPRQTVTVMDPDTGGLITKGTADLSALLVDAKPELVVADYKKREQHMAGRLSDPDVNYQTHAYAIGECQRLGARSYQTALLLFGDGQVEALWSRVYVEQTWTPILEAIRSVNVNQPDDPKGTSGPHCVRCWSRVHCPHWALPALTPPERVHNDLVPLTQTGGLTRDNAARALIATMALEEVAERARKQLEAFVRAEGPIDLGDGKAWKPINMPGRAGIDKEALERDGLLERYTKVGRPFQQFRIGKARP